MPYWSDRQENGQRWQPRGLERRTCASCEKPITWDPASALWLHDREGAPERGNYGLYCHGTKMLATPSEDVPAAVPIQRYPRIGEEAPAPDYELALKKLIAAARLITEAQEEAMRENRTGTRSAARGAVFYLEGVRDILTTS